MGVSTLIGKADGTTDAAAMYCTTTGWMVGPIFEAPDAADQIEAFLAWLGAGKGVVAARHIPGGVPKMGNGRDPREWEDHHLGSLISYWRANFVGDDGWLLDPLQCECGHTHIGDDGENVRGGECMSCPCTEWKPGNKAAELAAKEDADG